MATLKFDPKIAYEFYLASADGLCAVDRDLRYVTWNDALAKISGVSTEHALGRTVFELFPFLEAVGEREIHRRVFGGETVLADARPYDVPETGRKGYFQALYSPWRDESGAIVGLFMSIRDVGPSIDRLLSLRDLSNELARAATMQKTLDTTLEFLTKITGADRGVIGILSEDKKELITESLVTNDDAIAPRERVSIELAVPFTVAVITGQPVLVPSKAEATKFGNFYTEYLERSGDIATASIPLIVEGETIGTLGISYRTEHFFSNDEVNYLLAACNLCAQSFARARQFESEQLARAKAEEADRAKTRFLANVSHELRTPMTAVAGFAELVRNTFEGAVQSGDEAQIKKLNHFAESIVKHTHSLTRILDDILDLSKIESGRLKIEKELVSVESWITEIVQVASQLVGRKPITVESEIAPTVPRSLVTDPHRAKQIMLNLVSNAAKFTESGRIAITVHPGELHNGQQTVSIAVEDTGIGMKQQTSIYQPFDRQFSQNDRRGSGLGLAIASRLAHALDGSLRLITSELAKGTKFELLLPIGSAEKLANPNVAGTVPVAGIKDVTQKPLRGVNILAADDEPDVLEYVKEALAFSGANVITARDGAEVIELALTNDVDIFLLDLQMPKIDGFEAVNQLRESGITKPFIALSAHVLLEYQSAAIKAGFNRFLVKPVEFKTLTDTILELLEKSADFGANRPV